MNVLVIDRVRSVGISCYGDKIHIVSGLKIACHVGRLAVVKRLEGSKCHVILEDNDNGRYGVPFGDSGKERREGRSELLKITADSLDSGLTRISYQKEVFRTDAQPFVCGLRFRQGDPEETKQKKNLTLHFRISKRLTRVRLAGA